ncbi:MAG: 2-isopropylmalate synthase [Cyanobacteriota bacterium]|nr:2-isopropylmalate synthase [Cyanobacteriota bacterium]
MTFNPSILLFDTTLRDGELTPGVQFSLENKVKIAQQLEEIGVNTIEIGYPGQYQKDLDDIVAVSKVIKKSVVCALSGSQNTEILQAAQALEKAQNSCINLYTLVNHKFSSETLNQQTTLSKIRQSILQAKNHCSFVQWSAFDATRSDVDFLSAAIQTAVDSGAKVISIPDSLGVASPHEFYNLLQNVYQQVPQLKEVTVSVHCHNDLEIAVDNSFIGLKLGVRQIECAVNGLGARKGNANLAQVVERIKSSSDYQTSINSNLSSIQQFVSYCSDTCSEKSENIICS